jgi:hypothetical protein
LCGGANCAEFIGYYYREVVDEDGRYYPDFPVPRFECHGKGGHRIVPHRTFSLLHYHLVPYWKYSIPFIIKVLRARHIKGLSLKSLQDYIADFTGAGVGLYAEDDYIELSAGRIYSFKRLIREAVIKLLISSYYQELTGRLQNCSGSETETIKIFLGFSKEFECRKVSVPIRGPCALSYDFYLQGGSYFCNSRFLFGTPSQFRMISTGYKG